MLSLGTLGLTGAVMYGGVKALRRLLVHEGKRPVWLKSPQPVGVAAAVGAGESPRLVETAIADESHSGPAAFLHYIVQDEQGRKLSIMALGGTTAAIHILLGLQAGIPLFVWNGAGYMAFVAGQYFVPQWAPYRREVRDGFLAYTGTTFVAYFLVNGAAGLASGVGITAKLVEAGLIALLWDEEED